MNVDFVLISVAFTAIFAVIFRVIGRLVAEPLSMRSNGEVTADFGDAMAHMLLADLIRRNGLRLPKETPAYVLAGPQDYPSVFHWIVALFSRRFVERFEWLFSPVIEAMHAVLVFAVTYWLGFTFSWEQPVAAALLVSLVWISTPGLAMDIRRGAYLNERVFGFLFTHVYFLASIFWMLTSSVTYAIIAILAIVVVSVTSKFGMQAILFITPLWAFFLLDVRLLLLLVGGMVAAPLLTLGYSATVWQGSLRHTRMYATWSMYVHDYVTSFSTRQLVESLRHLLRGSLRAAWRQASTHPVVKGLFSFPVVFLAPLFWLLGVADVDRIVWLFLSFVLAAIFVFLLTTTDTLKFLGEGERYLEPVVLGSSLALMMLTPSFSHFLLAAVTLYGILRSCRWWIKHRRTDERGAGFSELLLFLRGVRPHLLICVPGRLCFPIDYFMYRHRYFWLFINAPDLKRQALFKRLFVSPARYPYPAPVSVQEAATAQKQPTLVVLHKAGAEAVRVAWGLDYGELSGKSVFENDEYRVLVMTGDDELV